MGGATGDVDHCGAGGTWRPLTTAAGAGGLLAGTRGRPAYLNGAGDAGLAAGDHGAARATGAAGAGRDDAPVGCVIGRFRDGVTARGLAVSVACLSWPRGCSATGSISLREAVGVRDREACARCSRRPCAKVSPSPPSPPPLLFGVVVAAAAARSGSPRIALARDTAAACGNAGRGSAATGGAASGAGAGAEAGASCGSGSRVPMAAPATTPAMGAAAARSWGPEAAAGAVSAAEAEVAAAGDAAAAARAAPPCRTGLLISATSSRCRNGHLFFSLCAQHPSAANLPRSHLHNGIPCFGCADGTAASSRAAPPPGAGTAAAAPIRPCSGPSSSPAPYVPSSMVSGRTAELVLHAACTVQDSRAIRHSVRDPQDHRRKQQRSNRNRCRPQGGAGDRARTVRQAEKERKK